jgi:hypothetical protein
MQRQTFNFEHSVHPSQKAGTLEAKWLIAIVGITVCGNYGDC